MGLIINTLVNQMVDVKMSEEEKYNYYSNFRL